MLAAGGDAAKVLFSGVGKTRAEMRLALQADVMCFNVESEAELEVLSQAAVQVGRTARVRLVEGAAEKLPVDDASIDFAASSFLMHELPQEVRVQALAEMARAIKPGGLIVIVDSIQKGDQPSWDGLLDLFPHYFHEPYYADYVGGSLEALAADAGLTAVASERAFLSKVAAFTR